jgi:hypothetical protein
MKYLPVPQIDCMERLPLRFPDLLKQQFLIAEHILYYKYYKHNKREVIALIQMYLRCSISTFGSDVYSINNFSFEIRKRKVFTSCIFFSYLGKVAVENE